jgi:tripartite-type tricarboxylate transporter receptor subunit TctC
MRTAAHLAKMLPKMLAIAVATMLLVAAAPARAQAWPTRQIALIVPYPPGGSLDVVAREVSERLGAALGQAVVVQNVGGASGNVGTAQVARAAPDGHTLLITTNAPLVFNRFFMKQMPFDALNDLAPVILSTITPIALAVHASLPVTSIAELLEHARRNPDSISFASSGAGSPHHIAGELLKSAAGISMRHVPYRGSSPAITDLIGGHVNAGFITMGFILPHAKSGSVRLLAMIEDARAPLLPDLPTISETVPAYRNAPTGWQAFMAPRETPSPVIARLNAEIGKALTDRKLIDLLAQAGVQVAGGTPELVTERIKAETEVMRILAPKIGIQPE